jgi:hypothetical protein
MTCKKNINNGCYVLVKKIHNMGDDDKVDAPIPKSAQTTIVTAFITKVNNIDFRSYDTYMEYGNKLLRLNVPTVMFVEQYMYDQYYKDHLDMYPQTHFIIFERHENYLYDFLPLVTNYEVISNNPKKDTIGYHFVQCHKTEWLRMAYDQNPFQTTNFTWVDFGIYHMIKNDDVLHQSIQQLSTRTCCKIRIASCIDPRQPCATDIYHQVVWFFAGSIIGGDANTLVQFSKLMKEACIQIIKEKKHIMWEVNIWYLLYQNYPTLFDFYLCDHDVSIIQNY